MHSKAKWLGILVIMALMLVSMATIAYAQDGATDAPAAAPDSVVAPHAPSTATAMAC